MSRRAYFTFISTNEYLPGLLVLQKTLRDVGSKDPLVVMTTPALPREVRDLIARRGLDIKEVDPLYPKASNLSAHDIRFAETWTKIRMFEQVEYDRLVVLDADMVVRRNMDELMDFDLPLDHIAAVHVCACNPRKLSHYPADWTPENCAHSSVTHPGGLTAPPQIQETSPRPYHLLNGGLIVLRPSLDTGQRLRRFLEESPLVPDFQFPDQDLYAEAFKGRWKPLPWCYNGLKTLRVAHPDLWRDEEVRCMHYILKDKPWRTPPGTCDSQYELPNQWWWDAFEEVRAELEMTDPEGLKLVEENVARG